MQNTIIKAFENHPEVVVAVYNEGGMMRETRDWCETFWDNFFLRGSVIFEETGDFSKTVYQQPQTQLPFGRGFIIDRDGMVAMPYFSHKPRMAIDKIYELLNAPAKKRTAIMRDGDSFPAGNE